MAAITSSGPLPRPGGKHIFRAGALISIRFGDEKRGQIWLVQFVVALRRPQRVQFRSTRRNLRKKAVFVRKFPKKILLFCDVVQAPLGDGYAALAGGLTQVKDMAGREGHCDPRS